MADVIEIAKRIDDVVELLTKGVIRGSDICNIITKKYNVSERQVYNYIEKAKEEIQKSSSSFNTEELKDLAIYRYNFLFYKNIDMMDYREARQVQQALDKITGIEAAQKVEVTNNISGEELDNRIKQLINK